MPTCELSRIKMIIFRMTLCSFFCLFVLFCFFLFKVKIDLLTSVVVTNNIKNNLFLRSSLQKKFTGNQKRVKVRWKGVKKSLRYVERGAKDISGVVRGQKCWYIPKLKFSSTSTKAFMNCPLFETPYFIFPNMLNVQCFFFCLFVLFCFVLFLFFFLFLFCFCFCFVFVLFLFCFLFCFVLFFAE